MVTHREMVKGLEGSGLSQEEILSEAELSLEKRRLSGIFSFSYALLFDRKSIKKTETHSFQ